MLAMNVIVRLQKSLDIGLKEKVAQIRQAFVNRCYDHICDEKYRMNGLALLSVYIKEFIKVYPHMSYIGGMTEYSVQYNRETKKVSMINTMPVIELKKIIISAFDLDCNPELLQIRGIQKLKTNISSSFYAFK